MNVSRGTIIVHVVFGLLLGWLYGGDLLDAVRIPAAEVSAVTERPSVPFASIVLIASAASLGIAIWGVRKGRGSDFKGFRLLPIVGVVALFVDLFLISPGKLPLSTSDQLRFVLEEFRVSIERKSSPQGVVTDEGLLRGELARFGKPPLLVRGEPLTTYAVQVRHGCDGPVADAPGVQAGTVIYCIAPDRKRAWITAVALPVGEKFGAPTVLRDGTETLFGVIDVAPPAPIPPELLEQLQRLDGGSPAPQ